MAVVDFCILPIGTQTTSVSPYIAQVEKVLRGQDKVNVELNAMGTTLEGNLDEALALIRKAQEKLFASGLARVYTVIKIDDRRDKAATLTSKVASVESKLSND